MLRSFDHVNYDTPTVLNNASTFPFMTWLASHLKQEKHFGGSLPHFTHVDWYDPEILMLFTEFW